MRRWWVGGILFAITALVVGWLDGWFMSYPHPGALMMQHAATTMTGASCAGNQDCLARESPIASFGDYRRCGGYIESVRAGDSQIGCSKAWLTDKVLAGRGEGDTFYRASRRACRSHDMCYTNARWTYAARGEPDEARAKCDAALLADSVRDCTLLSPLHNNWRRRLCRWRAMAAYTGVKAGGHGHFGQNAVCDYEPGPHGARDQVTSGRFVKLPGIGPEQVMTIVEEPEGRGITISLVALDVAAPLARLEGLTPGQVKIVDRDAFCDWKSAPTRERREVCPTTLAELGAIPQHWLHFPPIVVDGDGDKFDEVLLMSLSPANDLIVTRIVATVDAAGVVSIDASQAFAALDTAGDFAGPVSGYKGAAPGEFGQQLLAHNFVVVQRPQLECADAPLEGAEDVMMIGARAGLQGETSARRFYRMRYTDGVWKMGRDRFTDDKHFMSSCKGVKDEKAPNHTSRLEYTALAMRGPLRCSDESEIVAESLATIVRESCPSSSTDTQPGFFNDVDLMHYLAKPNATAQISARDSPAEMESATPSWLALTWSEVSDPVMTSRAARKQGIMLVSANVGGSMESVVFDEDKDSSKSGSSTRRPWFARKRSKISHFPFISVLRAAKVAGGSKRAWQQRLPDTVGQPPLQYALLQSKSSSKISHIPSVFISQVQRARSSQQSQRESWNRRTFGDPRMFFELPMVLAPFSIRGDEGISLVMFANCETYLLAHPEKKACEEKNDIGVVGGTVQVLIVQIKAPDKDKILPEPRWLECPIPDGAKLEQQAARGGAWQNSFLFNEPVLPGRFYPEKPENPDRTGGALAVTYRTQSGSIGAMSLRIVGPQWHLGPNACTTLSPADGNTEIKRNVWRAKLN